MPGRPNSRPNSRPTGHQHPDLEESH